MFGFDGSQCAFTLGDGLIDNGLQLTQTLLISRTADGVQFAFGALDKCLQVLVQQVDTTMFDKGGLLLQHAFAVCRERGRDQRARCLEQRREDGADCVQAILPLLRRTFGMSQNDQ
ncbi:hypothetical protein D3C84_1027790 [compost metagenome]